MLVLYFFQIGSYSIFFLLSHGISKMTAVKYLNAYIKQPMNIEDSRHWWKGKLSN